LGLLAACSTVDRRQIDQCQDDIDCGTESVCSFGQSNVCVPQALPPRAAIGFDIREGELRVELTGCDPEVSLELGGSELRVQKRSALVNTYGVRTTTQRAVDSCDGDLCAGTCDPDALLCAEPSSASLSLSMESRLGLPELRSAQKSYVTMTEPPPPEGELPPAVPFTWPKYGSTDAKAHSALVLDVTPPPETENLSSFRRVIAENAAAEVDAVGLLRCQRGLFSAETGVRTLAGSPLIGAGVEFVYAEPIATASTVIGAAPACVDDQDCPNNWACNEDGSCGLNLNGVTAGSTISTEELSGGFPPAWVYTYCEGVDAPVDDPLLRRFTVRVTPPVSAGLPNVIYNLDQPFTDPFSGVRLVGIDGQLCLPDWQPPQTVSFSLTGQPVALTETTLGVYACCSTECLPSVEPGVEPIPPPSVDSCSPFSRVRFETRWYNEDPLAWLFAGCISTAANNDGSSGRYVRDVSKCEDAGCSAPLTAGAADDPERGYSVSILQPPGSVFQSQRFNVQIDGDTSELEPFELVPRVLLRGQIICASGSACVATNAVVAAERIRVGTDEPDLPGPFFFETRVDATGSFVLPVDPGVYVITAYPAVSQPGGPARFHVIDLREGSPLIALVDGVPNATLNDPLRLDNGVLVRVALDGFEASTGVTPLDIGSWKAQDDFPVDLNDPQTCYGASARRGCLIRRVRPTDTPISLLITKNFQFTARRRGGDKCE